MILQTIALHAHVAMSENLNNPSGLLFLGRMPPEKDPIPYPLIRVCLRVHARACKESAEAYNRRQGDTYTWCTSGKNRTVSIVSTIVGPGWPLFRYRSQFTALMSLFRRLIVFFQRNQIGAVGVLARLIKTSRNSLAVSAGDCASSFRAGFTC